MDVSQDWKVLTIMIGANDLCASCAFNLSYLSPDDYENNLMGTLERVSNPQHTQKKRRAEKKEERKKQIGPHLFQL
jgi:hypothetical protein